MLMDVLSAKKEITIIAESCKCQQENKPKSLRE